METEIDYMMGTATFHINMQSGTDMQTYTGIFKVKCVPSPLDYINADAMYRKLLGDTNPQYASDYTSSLCYALAQLKYRLIENPSWFNNEKTGIKGSHVDDKILLYIFDKTIDAESEYRKGLEERYDKARETVKKAIDDGKLTAGEESAIEDDLDD